MNIFMEMNIMKKLKNNAFDYYLINKINYNKVFEEQINAIIKDNFEILFRNEPDNDVLKFKKCLSEVLAYVNYLQKSGLYPGLEALFGGSGRLFSSFLPSGTTVRFSGQSPAYPGSRKNAPCTASRTAVHAGLTGLFTHHFECRVSGAGRALISRYAARAELSRQKGGFL